MVAYRLDVANALFPTGVADGEVAGPTPARLLFLGDSAASGYGVLNHGLGVVSQSARYTAREHSIGCSWTTMTGPELTVTRAATQLTKTSLDVDAIVVIVGPPDVLTGTTVNEWSASLERIVELVRQGPRPDCAIVFAAVPPMYRFRSMPTFVKRILALQILRLNQTTIELAAAHPTVSYSPFPRLDAFGSFIPEVHTWRTIHSAWGRQLGATIANAIRPETLTN